MEDMRLVLVGCLLVGCTLYESKSGGGDDDGSGSGSGGGGPVGRSFLLDRTVDAPTNCPRFDQEEDAHNIDVMTTTVTVDGTQAAGPVVRTPPAREPIDPPNVVFTIFETWTSTDGVANPSIKYDVWVDGGLITGRANASFGHPQLGVQCEYKWTLSGF